MMHRMLCLLSMLTGLLLAPDLRAQQVPVQVSLPDTIAVAGETLRIPLMVSDLTGLDVSSSDILIHYDARVLAARDIRLTGTLTNRWTQAHRIDFVEGSLDTLGLVDIAVATANRIPSGSGVFLEIEFEVLDEALPGASSPLDLIEAILNGRDPATVTAAGSVTVDGFTGLPGDFNGDCIVNFLDFILFTKQFGSREGDPDWDPLFDLNDDGRVGFADFLIFIGQWGKTCE